MAVIGDPGILLMIMSLVFTAYLSAVVVRMKRKEQLHIAFLVLMSTLSLWSLGSLFLTYDYLMNQPTNPRMVELAYVGLILTPVAVLFLGVVFAKTRIRLNAKHSLLLVVPLISIILLFTNDHHHLFYRYILYEDLTRSESLGPYFIFHTAYSYVCIIIGMWHLVYFSAKNAGFFSRQSLLILAGILISFGYNALLTFQVIEGYFYSNVIAFFITFLFFFLAIIKFDFLNVVPMALQKVVDHISDGFLVIDRAAYIIDYNLTLAQTFEPIIKIRRKEHLTDLARRLESHPDIASFIFHLAESINIDQKVSFEKTLELEEKPRHFSVEVTPVYSNQGSYLSSIILLRDITQIKEAQSTIQRNHEILTEQERLVSLGQLIGGIAHNLKTPIMSISGGIEGLMDLIDEYEESITNPAVTPEDHREIAEEMRTWLKKMRPHCSYMSDVISAVKGQAAHFSTQTVMSFSLDELIKRVELLMKFELKRFHCDLNIHLELDHIQEIKGDVNSLVQVFDNLIINSIHSYDGKPGIIDLFVSCQKDHILFTLKDYGKGIPESIQNRLFSEMVTTKGKQGTGLGLYMSHATVKGKFAGKLWFESHSGMGTTFYISIPAGSSSNARKSEWYLTSSHKAKDLPT